MFIKYTLCNGDKKYVFCIKPFLYFRKHFGKGLFNLTHNFHYLKIGFEHVLWKHVLTVK